MSGLNLDIARRYLFGKKSTNSINIITGISVFGISIGTAALLLILSVFNGFEGLLSGLFNSFNPDIRVSVVEGKYFELNAETFAVINDIPGISSASRTIEEVALFEYRDVQELGMIKGVDDNYISVTGLDTLALDGKFELSNAQIQYAYIGVGMRNKLAINIDDKLSALTVYMPARKKSMMGTKEFNSRSLYPSGVFSVKSDSDYQYVIAGLDVVASLLSQESNISYLEIKLSEDADPNQVKSALSEVLGTGYLIQDRYQQDETFLKVMRIEKWISFLITGLTMLLIAFNLLGALWMIVLDKRKDIGVLKALGFNKGDIRSLFLNLGLMITGLGVVLGFILALGLYYLQKEWGLVGVPEGFLMDSYPVKLKILDFLLVSITVLFIGWMASILPSNKASEVSGALRT